MNVELIEKATQLAKEHKKSRKASKEKRHQRGLNLWNAFEKGDWPKISDLIKASGEKLIFRFNTEDGEFLQAYDTGIAYIMVSSQFEFDLMCGEGYHNLTSRGMLEYIFIQDEDEGYERIITAVKAAAEQLAERVVRRHG